MTDRRRRSSSIIALVGLFTYRHAAVAALDVPAGILAVRLRRRDPALHGLGGADLCRDRDRPDASARPAAAALYSEQQQREADFRFGLMRLRENRPSAVALSDGEQAERRVLSRRFGASSELACASSSRELILGLFLAALFPDRAAHPAVFGAAGVSRGARDPRRADADRIGVPECRDDDVVVHLQVQGRRRSRGDRAPPASLPGSGG